MKKISILLLLLAIAITDLQAGRFARSNKAMLEKAVEKISNELINQLPANSTLAVIHVSSDDKNTSLYAIDEIEYKLVNARKFKMVDRKRLGTIRAEQRFQMSGEVDDATAVSIGKMTGASIVITGEITKTGSTQRLSIRALDVKTAQIVSMVRESF